MLCTALFLAAAVAGCATRQAQMRSVASFDLNSISKARPSPASPNGRYVLYTVVLPGDAIDYTVHLKDHRKGTNFEILTYERCADAAWAPDSTHLLINSHDASNESTCLVYSLDHPLADPIDTRALLRRKDKEEAYWFVDSGKLYIDGEWVNDTRIQLNVEGYENDSHPGSYHFHVDYVLGRGFENLRQMPVEE